MSPIFLDRQPGESADTYISFAREVGGFLGVLVLPGIVRPGPALAEASRLGCNPGGEALFFLVPCGLYPTGRLLSEQEMRETGHRKLREIEPEVVDRLEQNSAVVCQDCNGGLP